MTRKLNPGVFQDRGCPGMNSVKPWIGHSKRMRCHRVLQQTQTSNTDEKSQVRNSQSTGSVQSESTEELTTPSLY